LSASDSQNVQRSSIERTRCACVGGRSEPKGGGRPRGWRPQVRGGPHACVHGLHWLPSCSSSFEKGVGNGVRTVGMSVVSFRDHRRGDDGRNTRRPAATTLHARGRVDETWPETWSPRMGLSGLAVVYAVAAVVAGRSARSCLESVWSLSEPA
jgi:hypothetical protein